MYTLAGVLQSPSLFMLSRTISSNGQYTRNKHKKVLGWLEIHLEVLEGLVAYMKRIG